MTRAQELEKRLGDATANVVTQNFRPRWFAWLKSDKQQEAEHPHHRPTAAADPEKCCKCQITGSIGSSNTKSPIR